MTLKFNATISCNFPGCHNSKSWEVDGGWSGHTRTDVALKAGWKRYRNTVRREGVRIEGRILIEPDGADNIKLSIVDDEVTLTPSWQAEQTTIHYCPEHANEPRQRTIIRYTRDLDAARTALLKRQRELYAYSVQTYKCEQYSGYYTSAYECVKKRDLRGIPNSIVTGYTWLYAEVPK